MNFGSWLARARAGAGVTQQAIADGLKVHFATVSNWESGRRTPAYQDVVRLARFLQASEDDALRAAGYQPLERMTAR